MRLPGNEIRHVRKTLGLTVAQFAIVLGVHASSVHRWEAAGPDAVPVDGLAANVLTALRQRVQAGPEAVCAARDTGTRVAEALLIGGTLVGLAVLLEFLVDRE